MANKSAEAPTTSVNPEALVFTGWTREGFWDRGQLLRGKEGRPVNITKYLAQKPQEARRATQGRMEYSDATRDFSFVAPVRTPNSLTELLAAMPSFSDLAEGWDVR